jgi:hypothetical protein
LQERRLSEVTTSAFASFYLVQRSYLQLYIEKNAIAALPEKEVLLLQ